MNQCLAGDLLLYRFLLVSLLCHWIVGVVGGRGLLHQYQFAGALKGCFASKTERAGVRERFAVMGSGAGFWNAEQKMEVEREGELRLSDSYQGRRVDGCADRGRRVVMKSGELNRGRRYTLYVGVPTSVSDICDFF
jgi:hypothetical protein